MLGPWWSGCAEKADYVQLAAESYHLPLKAAEPEPEAPPAAADSPSKGSDSPAADETPESKAGPAHSFLLPRSSSPKANSSGFRDKWLKLTLERVLPL